MMPKTFWLTGERIEQAKKHHGHHCPAKPLNNLIIGEFN
jgi:formylmethanofuran dehydrogenase subunit E